jgi:penicillin-binding protein 1A
MQGLGLSPARDTSQDTTVISQPDRVRYIKGAVFSIALLAVAIIGSLAGFLLVYSTDLPQVTELEHYRPSSVTEIYDSKGRAVGSFALQRRIIASYDDYPKVLRDAVTSIEDKDFEKHWGIDLWRIFGAAYRDIVSGSRAQGASTLTMQLSRNLFLTPDRKFVRKIQEIMLAIQIERRFTKPQIFTLYANQIFLGHGVYGFEAGAQYYFSKHAKDLTIDEAALLAGIPKGPSLYSPLGNTERALRRRNLVINNMMEDGKITAQQAVAAKATPIRLHIQSDPNSVAPYFVEEVRRYLEKKYGSEQVHEGGLRVYTTIDIELQKTANKAVLDGLAAYERRHGWKGKVYNVLAAGGELRSYDNLDWYQPIEIGTYTRALVTDVTPAAATIRIGKRSGTITAEDMKWTQQKSPADILSIGDVAYVRIVSMTDSSVKVALEQDSGAQGALLAIDNATGEVRAMVGGRDFDESKFNRAIQAQRQVGSSFKPYVYTAAVAAGVSPDDVILDAPVTFQTASGPYSPHNYDGKFEGNITVRRALALSRNIPALKLEMKVGVPTVIATTRKFGVTSDLPPVIPLALGSADMTLWEQVSAYSTFPNDGVRVTPHLIRKVTDYSGRVLEEDFPDVHDVIPAHTARVMTNLLQEVVKHGTAFSASKLNHPLAGKTGTTNDFTDAWFIGFSPSITAGVWIGYDEKKTLGPKESGAMAALPMWIDFMKIAILDKPDEKFPELSADDLLAMKPQTPVKVDTPDFRPSDAVTH